jgi:ketosteroid isomerase-like protein
VGMDPREHAIRPEDLTRLFVERANAGDAEGLAELYAADAVLGFPAGSETVGREAIRAVLEAMLDQVPTFPHEEPLPSLIRGDLALCATRSADGTGTRAQVAERQPDGRWLRIIDRPESR